jgi:hypothetical protein
MRLSRIDKDDPTGTKRRHFEISIDSPFHILSCLATQAHTELPQYSDLNAGAPAQTYACGCPNAAVTNNSSPASSSNSVPTMESLGHPTEVGLDGAALPVLAVPPQAHLSTSGGSGVQRPHAQPTTNGGTGTQRPIHMIRNPSYNPPAFDAEEPPPPLATPPPGYDMVIGTPSHDGLADYFARYVTQSDIV